MKEIEPIQIFAKSKIEPQGGFYELRFAHYGDSSRALMLFRGGLKRLTITVCIPEYGFLKDDEVLVKTWSENEGLAESLVEAGLFTDTGRRVKAGMVKASVYKLHHENVLQKKGA